MLTSWGVIVSDVLSRIFGDAHYEGLLPLMRRKIEVFQGDYEVVSASKSAVRMDDFVLMWQVGQGASALLVEHYLSQSANRQLKRIEGLLRAKLIKRPTSSYHHNWTEIGVFLKRELREIAEAWMELSANRGSGG